MLLAAHTELLDFGGRSVCPAPLLFSSKKLLSGFYILSQLNVRDVNVFLDAHSDSAIISYPVFVSHLWV